jgi:hypothetical protein
MIVTGMAPRRGDELGLNASGVRGGRRLQRGVAVERGARREAYRRSVSVGPGRGGVDRRVRHLLGPRPRRHPGLGSPMGNGARPSRMRSPPRARRDRARVGARSVRDSERAARLTPSPAIGHLSDADHDNAVPGARRGRASGREGHDDRTDISCRPHSNRQQPMITIGINPHQSSLTVVAAQLRGRAASWPRARPSGSPSPRTRLRTERPGVVHLERLVVAQHCKGQHRNDRDVLGPG